MSIFLDPGGSVVISPDGTFLEMDDLNSMRQRIYLLFNTPIGTHPLFPEFGFDIITLLSNITLPNELMVYSLVVSALTPKNVYGLKELKRVDVEIVDTTAYVDVEILTENNQTLREIIQVALP